MARVGRPGSGHEPQAAWPLVEREHELASIGAALDGARGGRGHVLVLEGEAGSGKTRLVGEARALAAERGLSVLDARGATMEKTFTFGVARQLFERPLADAGDAERDDLLAGAAAPLRTVLGRPPAVDTPPVDALFSLVHGLYWLAARLAERHALLVTVDDLHWADEPSQRALAYLAARTGELPLALLLTIRLGDDPPAVDPREWCRTPDAGTILRLRPLSERSAARVLAEFLGPVSSQFARTAHRAAGGNAHLLRELAVAIASEGLGTDDRAARRIEDLVPETLAPWALLRLARLGTAAEALACSLSVLERAPLTLAAAHATLALDEAHTAADRLSEAGLLARELPLRFAHPLIREALHGSLAPAARSAAHRRAAELLVEHEAPAQAIAAHLLRCERVGADWAATAIRSAAGEAAARGDLPAAMRLLRRALAEPGQASDPGMLVELGSVETALAEPAGIERLETAIELTDDPSLHLGARAALSNAKWLKGDFAAALEEVLRALDTFEPGSGGALEAQLLVGLVAGRAVPELADRAGAVLRRPRAGPDGVRSPAEFARMALLGFDLFVRGERPEAERLALQVAERPMAPGPASAAESLIDSVASCVLTWLGRYVDGVALAERAGGRARAAGHSLALAASLEVRFFVYYWGGQVNRSLAASETLLAFGEQTGAYSGTVTVGPVACRAHHMIEAGDLGGARRHLTLPIEVEDRLRGVWGWYILPFGRAQLAAAEGRWQEALDQTRLCGERMEAGKMWNPDWIAWRSPAARAAARLDQRDLARELAGEELRRGQQMGSARATGIALAALASAANGSEQIELLTEAVSQLDRANVPLERARARLELGMALRRSRHPKDARQPLREAVEIGSTTGATVLADLARSELHAAGGRPRRERVSGIEALTPREREVAELATAGRSNPQIAEALFVTRKTVEGHLRTTFRKLGVSSRDELGRLLHQQ